MSKYISDQLPGRTAKFQDGNKYLWFSGTDYLGLGNNEEFRSLLNEGFNSYGSHFGSSRNNSMQLSIFEQAESAIAFYTKSPKSLTVSSGMWAGQLLMKEIENIVSDGFSAKPIYYYSPRVHPALWGNKFISSSASWKDWAIETVENIRSSADDSTNIVCTDSIGSPFVEELDFTIFKTLPPEKDVWLIVDDSHGLGVTGNAGSGIYEKIISQKNLKLIVTASLNKAMGIPAGVILADENVINILQKSPWFSGASPCAPVYSYALKKFLDHGSYQKAFYTLQSNIRYFKSKIPDVDFFSEITDYPVFCSRNESLFPFLLNHGIMASCFSYPLATDPPVTRIVISAIHQNEDLNHLAEVFLKFKSAL